MLFPTFKMLLPFVKLEMIMLEVIIVEKKKQHKSVTKKIKIIMLLISKI